MSDFCGHRDHSRAGIFEKAVCVKTSPRSRWPVVWDASIHEGYKHLYGVKGLGEVSVEGGHRHEKLKWTMEVNSDFDTLPGQLLETGWNHRCQDLSNHGLTIAVQFHTAFDLSSVCVCNCCLNICMTRELTTSWNIVLSIYNSNNKKNLNFCSNLAPQVSYTWDPVNSPGSLWCEGYLFACVLC